MPYSITSVVRQLQLWLLLLGAAILLAACFEAQLDEPSMVSQIVVEGWIEEGSTAHVMLSRTVPMNITLDSSIALNYVLRAATVTVSDGQQQEVLALRSDPARLPPFVYTGRSMRGQAGKTYTLTVKYAGRVLTAQSTMHASVPLLKATYQKTNAMDTTGTIWVEFEDPVEPGQHYQLSTLVYEKEEVFIPSLYGTMSDERFTQSLVGMQLIRGITIFPETNISLVFHDHDQILVKLRTLDKPAFDFWNSWQNELLNGQNALFPSTRSLHSNIQGGIGFWGAYGQSVLPVYAMP